MPSLDTMDIKILACLQDNARLTNVELSKLVNLSPSQCHRRIRQLEESGVVRRYVTLLNPAAVGLGVQAIVNVALVRHNENAANSFREAIQRLPEILECHTASGDADYVLRVVAEDLKSFSDFLMTKLLPMPIVNQVKSSILLDELKSTTALPLDERR